MLSAIERYAYKSNNLWDTTYKTKPMRHGLREAAYETQLLKWTYKMQLMRCIRAVTYFSLSGFYVGGVPQQFGNILIGEKLDSKLVR